MAAQSFTATIASTGAIQLPQAITFTLSATADRATVINLPDDATLIAVLFETNDGHVDLRQTTADNATITPATDPVLPVLHDSYFTHSIDAGVRSASRIKQIAVSSSTGSTRVRAFIEGKQG